jgi:hypothetical protein
MRSVKDIEAYLGRLNRRFHPMEAEAGKAGEAAKSPNTFLISSGDNFPPVALRVDPPLVVVRVHIGDVPKGEPTELFRKLLQLNAKGLVHSSYGIDDNRIILSSALELENLDFNELEATLDEIDIALAQHVPLLSELSKK